MALKTRTNKWVEGFLVERFFLIFYKRLFKEKEVKLDGALCFRH